MWCEALERGHAPRWLDGGKLRGAYGPTRFRGGSGERRFWCDERAGRRCARDARWGRSVHNGRTLTPVTPEETGEQGSL